MLRLLMTCVALLLTAPQTVLAGGGDPPTGKGVILELNSAVTVEGACRLSFLAQNLYAQPITSAVYETVLFTAGGDIDRLTLFDFGTLPVGRPRVRQFDIQGVACDTIGRVLINGASTCTGEGLPDAACDTGLVLRSRTTMELLG
ncbi:hypothetical protein [Puniceibacterium sediminis]|uniref:Tat pathway signal sequence domain protein n=1 Tax=Puniceibacterium sediminis TaxID=1608407 RepID=A0A238YS50_9RHOB|nr:hypothetical protein [Puniceibacterium sediminis]SNR73494.1 hypothetical protein SAMN06265370_11950 [Puniceibacterium sediminis]